jgi:hypothetical protein
MPDRPSDLVQATLDMLNTRSGPRADCSSTIERDGGSGFAVRSNRNRAGVLGAFKCWPPTSLLAEKLPSR